MPRLDKLTTLRNIANFSNRTERSNGPKSMQICIGNEIFPQIFSGARAGHTCSGDFDRFTARAVGFIFFNIVGVLSFWKG